MKNRTDQIRAQLRRHEADAALITCLPHIRWACGFSGSNAILIVQEGTADFVSDGRYRTQARREIEGAAIHIADSNLLEYASEAQLLDDATVALFQSDHLTVDQRRELGRRFGGVTWKPVAHLLNEQVAAKDAGEIERVRDAQRVTDAVFEHLCHFIEPGIAERDVAAEIVYQHLKRGAEKMSFEPIVASGPNASLPHARPTGRKLRTGDFVVIDMGGIVNGYASDMTRTVAIGAPDDEMRASYEAVLEAQKRAVAAARAGMTGKELDAVARNSLDEAGLGAYFSHSLGHGIGLQTHEWPRLSQRVEHVLPEGATVTIEPGVYVPEQYGVRIEDIVALQHDGCQNLTASPKELIAL